MKGINQRIKNLRRIQDMTQQELATRAGLSISEIIKLESGRHSPRIDTLGKIAEAFGMPIHRLLDDSAAAVLPAAA